MITEFEQLDVNLIFHLSIDLSLLFIESVEFLNELLPHFRNWRRLVISSFFFLSIYEHVSVFTLAAELTLQFARENWSDRAIVELEPVLNQPFFRVRNREVTLIVVKLFILLALTSLRT